MFKQALDVQAWCACDAVIIAMYCPANLTQGHSYVPRGVHTKSGSYMLAATSESLTWPSHCHSHITAGIGGAVSIHAASAIFARAPRTATPQPSNASLHAHGVRQHHAGSCRLRTCTGVDAQRGSAGQRTNACTCACAQPGGQMSGGCPAPMTSTTLPRGALL